MPLNANEIRVAGTGQVLVGPIDAPMPTNTVDPWDPRWLDLGYTSGDGIKLVKKDKLDPVDTWQTVAAIRFFYSDRDLSVKFSLLQVNQTTVPFFFGGGEIKEDEKAFRYDVMAAPRPDERALGIEFRDGPTVTHRFVIPRGVVTETDESTISRNAAIKLGVTFSALTPLTGNGEPLAYWLMSKPPAASAGTNDALTRTAR